VRYTSFFLFEYDSHYKSFIHPKRPRAFHQYMFMARIVIDHCLCWG